MIYTGIIDYEKEAEEQTLQRLSQFTSFHVKVDKIIFHTPDNSFSIIAVSSKSPRGKFTAKTTFPFIYESGIFNMEGSWKNDKKYGLQFIVDKMEQTQPDDNYGLARYLSENIKGLGRKSAQRIVDEFGKKTTFVLNNMPDALYSVKGLRKSKIPGIIASWRDHKEVNELYIFLTSIHVDAGCAKKIYAKYGSNSISNIKQNPYCLTDIEGIGFITADNVAKEMGMEADNPFRLRSGLLYTLEESSHTSGNVYETRSSLLKSALELLGISDKEKLEKELDFLLKNEKLKQDGARIYLPKLYKFEFMAAKRLIQLTKAPRGTLTYREENNAPEGLIFNETQKAAIKMALEEKVMVLTGGPGTGKTTTTKGIIAAWKEAGLDIVLAAPTGRAAKRLSEVTDMPASTIHKLLGYQGTDFGHNEEDPIEGDALIVDEASMIDIELLYNLLRAIPLLMRVVFVGDVDQLPSVGPGNVLRDIIDSGVIPVVKLSTIFRQAEGSRIITNAHLINTGKPIVYDNSPKSDFFFLPEDDPEAVTRDIVDMVTNRLPSYYHIEPRDIQVLSPMRRSCNGVTSLNKLLQSVVNPNARGVKFGSVEYRVNDKVMQMANDYNKDVFNGDMGFVVDVDTEEETILVDFGKETPLEYDAEDAKNLSLAYASTIHKSQGSEYPIVVMPITMQFYIMLQRNLLYTGVTRAKKVCVIIGDKKAVSMAIRNGKTVKRNTALSQRLRDEDKEAGLL